MSSGVGSWFHRRRSSNDDPGGAESQKVQKPYKAVGKGKGGQLFISLEGALLRGGRDGGGVRGRGGPRGGVALWRRGADDRRRVSGGGVQGPQEGLCRWGPSRDRTAPSPT